MIEIRNINFKIDEYLSMNTSRTKYKKAFVDKKIAESMITSLNNLLNSNSKESERKQILDSIDSIQSLLFHINFFLIECEGKFGKIEGFENGK